MSDLTPTGKVFKIKIDGKVLTRPEYRNEYSKDSHFDIGGSFYAVPKSKIIEEVK